jgi:hypothetical protein
MRIFVQWLVLVAAVGASVPASAELYRWVDERGVTNYSNEPPPATATAKKLTHVADRISVYTPDEQFMKAVKTMRERSLQAMAEPEAPRNPVARISAQPQSGYEQCLMSGRIGCEELYGSYVPAYLPGVLGAPLHRVQPTRFLAPRPVVASAARVRGSPMR